MDPQLAALMREVHARWGQPGRLWPDSETPDTRTDGQRTFVFLQNFTYEFQTVRTTAAYTDYETGNAISGNITLQPLQTVVLVKE